MDSLPRTHPRRLYQCLFGRVDDFILGVRYSLYKRRVEKSIISNRLGNKRIEAGPDDNNVTRYYNLKPTRKKEAIAGWHIQACTDSRLSKRITQIWLNYNADLTVDVAPSALIRPRVEIVLLKVLARAREASRLRQSGSEKHPEEENEGPISVITDRPKQCPMDLVIFTSPRVITMPFMRGTEQLQVTSHIDNVFFAGDMEDLDAVLLVLTAPQRHTVCSWSLVKSMAMIHHARKKVGLDSIIYGVATDSVVWAFARIDNESRYSRWFLDWRTDSSEIIALIHRILCFAAYRALVAARAPIRARSVSQVTGCRILRPDELV
ncbi:hypothetical protein BJX61DRAFT_539922 [Aspergillus egyptiacus]|nr:hypothetical protein BJX61DRAFT_539922 [Aspergillus egyptiacus]